MLSKSSTMLLGLIHETPLNAYQIIKQLQTMNVQRWFYIANSTVYATLKTLEKKQYICGTIEKAGNMPDKTIYSLTVKGQQELYKTLKQSILTFDYDTNIFSVAAFFIELLDDNEDLLSQRLTLLNRYLDGIKQKLHSFDDKISSVTIANIERSKFIIEAEICGTERLWKALATGKQKTTPQS